MTEIKKQLADALCAAFDARLNELRFSITVPAAELTMALAAVLLARFVQAGVRVRRENDSFI